MENNEKNYIYQYAFYDEKNEDLIADKELEYIHPYLENKFPSPTVKSGIMKIDPNDPEKIIDNPENFRQYHS